MKICGIVGPAEVLLILTMLGVVVIFLGLLNEFTSLKNKKYENI